MPIYDSRWSDSIFPLFLAVCCISLMAGLRIDLPWHELNIAITGQSLAVLVVAYLLGRKLGVLAILLYLLLGILGAPIFAKGASGFAVLLKGSGGFLYGFIPAAWVLGKCGELEIGRNIFKGVLAMALGTLIILFFGVVHLSVLYDVEKALRLGCYPFIPGALVKIAIGALAIYLWHLLRDAWIERKAP